MEEKSLQKSIYDIKASREMRGRYMIFEEMMRDERKEGRLEGKKEAILELLEDLGEIPEAFHERLDKETDELHLRFIHKAAAKSESMEEFLDRVRDIRNS